jgi:hypothetical protein
MLADWERQSPGRLNSIFAALQNVAASHLADTGLFDFAALGSAQDSRPNWFDAETETADADDPIVATVSVESLLRSTPRARAVTEDI